MKRLVSETIQWRGVSGKVEMGQQKCVVARVRGDWKSIRGWKVVRVYLPATVSKSYFLS